MRGEECGETCCCSGPTRLPRQTRAALPLSASCSSVMQLPNQTVSWLSGMRPSPGFSPSVARRCSILGSLLRADWLGGDEWELVLFTDSAGTTVGYPVYRLLKHEYYQNRQAVSLRQFFIDRPFRGRGLGHAAYLQLENERFGNREVSLNVLATNPGGRRFWEKMGFSEYYVSMKKG